VLGEAVVLKMFATAWLILGVRYSSFYRNLANCLGYCLVYGWSIVSYNEPMEGFNRRTLLDRKSIEEGLDALAERIAPGLEGKEVTVIPILGGAMIFAADLVRRLPAGLVMDFLRIQTYGDEMSPQKEASADWLPHPDNVRGKHILLLDDILDTGRTMQEARRLLIEDMGAVEVTVVVFVDKPVRRQTDVVADDALMVLNEDLFLVGFGLDLAGRYRNLPDLLALEPHGQDSSTTSEKEATA